MGVRTIKKIFVIGFLAALIGAKFYFQNEGKGKENHNKEDIKIEKQEEVKGEKMEKKILKREDIDKKYKWNLEEYYPSWEVWDRELAQTRELMKKVPEYKGK